MRVFRQHDQFILNFNGLLLSQTEANDVGVNEADIWLGLPRAGAREAAQLRVAPGAGEWSLYPWGALANPRSLGDILESPLGDF